jgi:hypothetical protein
MGAGPVRIDTAPPTDPAGRRIERVEERRVGDGLGVGVDG